MKLKYRVAITNKRHLGIMNKYANPYCAQVNNTEENCNILRITVLYILWNYHLKFIVTFTSALQLSKITKECA